MSCVVLGNAVLCCCTVGWVKSQLTKMAALTQEVSQGQKNSANMSATVHPAHYDRRDANVDANQCWNGNTIISIIVVVVEMPFASLCWYHLSGCIWPFGSPVVHLIWWHLRVSVAADGPSDRRPGQ